MIEKIEEEKLLTRRLSGNSDRKRVEQAVWVENTCETAKGQDILVVHSPGGWGCSDIDHLIDWEESVVKGIQDALTQMGYNIALVQYFRAGRSSWNHVKHIPAQVRYFFTGQIGQAEVMAAGLKSVADNLTDLKIVLLGVSQGAAFNNTVMKYLDSVRNIYSIELGTFFAQLQRRVITERTLAIDSNGLMLDPVVHRNLRAAMKAYIFAPFSWMKYKLAGETVKFTYCISVPGHDYNWRYPSVQGQIINFLKSKLPNNTN